MRKIALGGQMLGLAMVGLSALAGAVRADDFVAPPMAERDAVAALAKLGARPTIDAEYRVVNLSLGANISNEDLKSLAHLERLTQLSVNSAKIDDVGVEHLKGLKKLTTISITRSGISAEGIAALRAALPDCRVSSFGGSRGGDRGGPGDRGPAAAPAGFGGFSGGGFGGGGGGGFAPRSTTLVRNTAVQDDLKLSPEQRTQIAEVNSTAALTAAMQAVDAKVLAVLTPEQKARLKQIELQQGGVTALLRAEVATQLKLSDEQKASARKINDEAAASARAASAEILGTRGPGDRGREPASAEARAKAQEKVAEINKDRDARVLAVLTDEQRKTWETMTGPKGPALPQFASRFPSTGPAFSDPATSAKTVFERYDADKDGAISDAEFPMSNRTRANMTRAGVMLEFPVAREEFEKAYVKYLQGQRTRE